MSDCTGFHKDLLPLLAAGLGKIQNCPACEAGREAGNLKLLGKGSDEVSMSLDLAAPEAEFTEPGDHEGPFLACSACGAKTHVFNLDCLADGEADVILDHFWANWPHLVE